MKSYDSYLVKIVDELGKGTVYKTTCINPNSENKGSSYVFNNINHVNFSNRETVKNVLTNILKNGCCNGIPQEIGGIEDRTITSIVLDLREIKDLNELINDTNIVLSEVKLELGEVDKANEDRAKVLIKILKDFKDNYHAERAKDFEVIYFDIYDPVLCSGYMTLNRNGMPVLDFVRMQGYSSVEELIVAGRTTSGVNVGYIRPAPFAIGPIEFNPIGNDAIDLNSEGMLINYIGLLREDPTNFKEFRVYLTLTLSANTSDGKFIGRSQEMYDNFVKFIEDANKQAKEGGELDWETHKLPIRLSKIKVEIQGDNPGKITANDVATIINKAFMVLTTKDLVSVVENGDSLINPKSYTVESDNECSINLSVDNEMYLEPIFVSHDLKK